MKETCSSPRYALEHFVRMYLKDNGDGWHATRSHTTMSAPTYHQAKRGVMAGQSKHSEPRANGLLFPKVNDKLFDYHYG